MPPSLLCSITIKLMSHSQTTRIKIFLWHRNYISKQVLEPKKRRNVDVWGKIHRPITNFRLRGEIWYSVVRSDELKLQEIYTKCFILYYLSRPLPGGVRCGKSQNPYNWQVRKKPLWLVMFVCLPTLCFSSWPTYRAHLPLHGYSAGGAAETPSLSIGRTIATFRFMLTR